MVRLIVATALLLAGLPAGYADDKTTTDDLKKLEGAWSPVSAEVDGKPVPEAHRPPRLEFKASRFLGLDKEMAFTIDPSRSPKHIDFVARTGGVEIKIPAIYELNGDDLTLCIPLAGKAKALELQRPGGFDGQAAPSIAIRLKRAK